MKIIVGLGNPGAEYALTRHNAGMLLVDKMADTLSGESSYGWRKFYGIYVFKTPEVMLAKTGNYFMNQSGSLINDLRNLKYDFRDLYVAHDDLDLNLGDYKIQFGKGPKVHNGVNSVEEALGTKDFWRVRIGIDKRAGEQESSRTGEEYVLQKFTAEERETLEEVLEKIMKGLT